MRYNATNMHRQQNGFSHILLIILVLVAAGVGFAGWRVYQLSKGDSSNSSEESKSATADKEQSSKPEETPNVETSMYEKPDIGLSFEYPKGWKVNESTNQGGDCQQSTEVVIKSPDYEEKIGDESVAYIINGGEMSFSYCKEGYTGSHEEALADALEGFDYWSYETVKEVTVSDVKAIRGVNGHWTRSLTVALTKNGADYTFRYSQPQWYFYQSDEYKTNTPEDKYLNEFEKLVASIKID